MAAAKTDTEPTTEPRFISTRDVMAMLGVKCEKTVRKLSEDGTLPQPIRLGRSVRYDAAAVRAALDRLDSA